jgi:hypothetical protein
MLRIATHALVVLAGIDLLKLDGKYTYAVAQMLTSMLRSFGLM